jgi:mono/diheme cytochrome c family protein
MRYVVREKGKVELGILSCAMCHTRVMPDGTVIKGAQGNFPDDRAFAYETRKEAVQAQDKDKPLRELRNFMRRSYAAPWLDADPNAQPERMTLEEIASALEAIVPGVCARQGSSAFYPPHIPDLIGVKDRHYLDASGLVRHRSIGDLMRYAALNQGADELSSYGDYRPKGELPDPSTESRYSDEQLYALALYVYSLKPPPNPNQFDSLAARGKELFAREGCSVCHTPPLYTNNKLTPAGGFKVPDEHGKQFDISPTSVGTDTRLTLTTRRGTGYYKVPSLKGVWYRGPFEHNGSVATLEDWFDRRRLRDDYVPTGFRGYGVKARAVKGHPFGLDLSIEDRKALIKFLKTL